MEGGESGWQIRWRIRRKIREGSSLLAAGFVTARSVSDDTPGRRRERREIRDREIKTSGGWSPALSDISCGSFLLIQRRDR